MSRFAPYYIRLYNRAEILTIITLIFWSKLCLHKIISVFTDLYRLVKGDSSGRLCGLIWTWICWLMGKRYLLLSLWDNETYFPSSTWKLCSPILCFIQQLARQPPQSMLSRSTSCVNTCTKFPRFSFKVRNCEGQKRSR